MTPHLRTSRRVAETLIITVTLLLVFLGLAFLAASASAQELPGDGTPTPTPTPEGTDVVEQLGDLVVHSYEYDGDVMTVKATWRGDTPTTLTLVEMLEMDSGGATEISYKQVRLLPDETTTIEIALEERSSGTAAALLSTPESVERGDALVLQSGDVVERGPIPFGTASLLIGLAAIGGAGMAFALTARSYRDDHEGERRERIA
ncbi:hypothetical protein [Halapricum hydrolyticum]|uniref:Uncharacterized protein n=1 Tax=Halapricum hydrolyticum TaxID=2979991 RepID=A0AAE3IBU0_9EURY|nr:hypothetical protein [Halapricum hydrolyticum]MCU4716810.1 hypothetical protein [Halapricum hydrolyticum]MCU4725585.1 hypothetical protein [Halapricum hydrolyticum]